METILQGLDILMPVLYAAVFGAYLWQFWRSESDDSIWTRRALYGLLGLHFTYFGLRWVHFGFFPLGSKAEFYSWLALSVAVAYGFVERQLEQSRTGAFFVGISGVFQIFASVFMTYSTKHPLLLENPVYALHVIFMIFGVTALAVGALYALMYVILSRQLKARDLGVFFKRLPPLRSLDRMTKTGTVAGTALLGLGLIVGYLVAFTVDMDYEFADPKYMATNAIWLGYLVGIVFVKVRGLPGLRVAYATVAWFAVLLVSVGLASHSFQQ